MDEEKPKVDLAAVLYIALGIPSIVGFAWVLFALVKAFNLPA